MTDSARNDGDDPIWTTNLGDEERSNQLEALFNEWRDTRAQGRQNR